MFDFTFHNPTKIEFGRGKERNIGLYLREFDAKRTLLIYGSDRIKKDGLFDAVAASLKENGIEFTELGGVVSNPVLSKVYEGIELASKFNADSVLARKLKLKFWNAKKYQSIINFPKRMDLWERWSELYKNVSKEASETFYLKNKAFMDDGARVLWEDALPILKLMQKRAENLKSFNKEQQNDPRSETQIFTKESMHFYRELPRCDYFVMYIDPAGEKKKSDYTAITVLGVSKAEAKIYVAESIVEVMKTKKTIKEIIRLNQLYKCRVCAIESNGGQEFFRGWIREKAFEIGIKLPLKGVNNTASKGQRIEELEVPIEDGEILFHQSQSLLIEQLTEYPEAKHDDAPDSLAGAYDLTKLKKKVKRRTR